MRSIGFFASCLVASAVRCLADINVTEQISKQILPNSFTPPQVFQHANLVRTISLAKSYTKETVNVVVENVDKQSQKEYYLPFEASTISRIGGLEVKDKNNPDIVFPKPQTVEYDAQSATQYYKIELPKALAPKDKITLSITWNVLSTLTPLPALIDQSSKQYVEFRFSTYTSSAYKTIKQKTNLKLSTTDVPDYTTFEKTSEGKDDPQKQGTTFTYGPYADIPAGALQQASVRYEYTKPLLHVSLLERDIEVSHWGGNIATEERYWLENRGAQLKSQFSRLKWQQMQYYNPPTSAAKQFTVPLAPGSLNPYFIDDIGNVSTSRFRSNAKEALLELKPRYPIFGGWKYKFRIGWDANLKNSLRKLKAGPGYVLKVPFLEGPKEAEGVEYGRVVLRIILPEGADNIKYETNAPIVSSETSRHRTFMDTLGRTTLELVALNVADEARDRNVVVTYDYPFLAGFRKPIVIFSSILGLFGAAWVVSQLDVSIGRKR
ncbi:Ribophorin I [Myriangium duriaei CBS 260.36]|uniref:Dolichyl-diphosphooligosaccharide--protein glycosyltransferase subunit 1 n=1 Tax=Myriangium duriaei CBS 260.36 TaxID=1168546 RepID=A0A9P4IZ72_9PEZI|nr:Ribophorin I [Myriangium duriaei CBS 260.36]